MKKLGFVLFFLFGLVSAGMGSNETMIKEDGLHDQKEKSKNICKEIEPSIINTTITDSELLTESMSNSENFESAVSNLRKMFGKQKNKSDLATLEANISEIRRVLDCPRYLPDISGKNHYKAILDELRAELKREKEKNKVLEKKIEELNRIIKNR